MAVNEPAVTVCVGEVEYVTEAANATDGSNAIRNASSIVVVSLVISDLLGCGAV